jgi:hypothetical protein
MSLEFYKFCYKATNLKYNLKNIIAIRNCKNMNEKNDALCLIYIHLLDNVFNRHISNKWIDYT